jgi:hypothetical protein
LRTYIQFTTFKTYNQLNSFKFVSDIIRRICRLARRNPPDLFLINDAIKDAKQNLSNAAELGVNSNEFVDSSAPEARLTTYQHYGDDLSQKSSIIFAQHVSLNPSTVIQLYEI